MSFVVFVATIAWTTAIGSQTMSTEYLDTVPVNETQFDLKFDDIRTVSIDPEFIRKNSSFTDLQNTTQNTEQYERDYVKPVKSISQPLHEHDILYAADQDTLSKKGFVKHHSGHYRHNTASIWDPHPQYDFIAFGRPFHLKLFHDSKFVSPDINVIHMKQNMSWKEPPSIKVDGCFYSGSVLGEPDSVVSVSLCNGITGYIRTTTDNYFIEPTVDTINDHVAPALHTIYRTHTLAKGTGRPPHRSEQNCGVQDKNVETDINTINDVNDTAAEVEMFVTNHNRSIENDRFFSSTGIPFTPKSRKKRSLSSENVIELLIVADKKMADYHGKKLDSYILTLMSMVSKIFKDKSIGNPMHVTVVKLTVLRDNQFVQNRRHMGGVVASEMLQMFCKWQSHHNDENDYSKNHHDAAILITREHLCRRFQDQLTCDTLGLAHIGTMCEINSCAIVQDNGLGAAFTIAHELGHVLNMLHDNDNKCKDYPDKKKMNFVMSTTDANLDPHPWTWSTCSRHYLTEYLEADHGKCLQNDPSTDYLKNQFDNRYLPGENYSVDKQCELIYGPGWKVCDYMPSCKKLYCTKHEKEGCKTQHMPWADGTPCWDDKNWCQQGKCVPKDREALKPVDGGWGDWQPFGECTRTCGGGVTKSFRECTDPTPSNGGKFCIGQRVREKSCATNECPPGTPDFRGEQCASFNNNPFNIQDLDSNVKWLPKYGSSENERCRLYCRVADSASYYLLAENVVDGTPCEPDKYDVCVHGVCKKAGCDHILDSDKTLDLCGVCGGDNTSCRSVNGWYNSSQQGYSEVLRIPAGSSNLDIRQYGRNGADKDDNYLVLVDSTTGKYILNGDYVMNKASKVIKYGGAVIEYSGSDVPVERINSSKPLNRDLTVKVLSMGSQSAPDIKYQYTVMRDERDVFVWEWTDKWGQCDKICSGEQTRIHVCINRVTGKEARGFCNEQNTPRSQKQKCNLHCTIKWMTVSQSECSAQCGPGTRAQSVACVQESQNEAISQLSDTICSHLPKPADTIPCTGQCLESKWSFTNWSPCSKTCGSGVQYREAHCVNDNGESIEESSCNDSEKIVSRTCGMEKCPQWSVGEWSSCSVTCGDGHKERLVSCRMDNGRVLASEYCGSNTPASREPCYHIKPCPAWITGPWSSCSVSCGDGIVKRIVRCNVKDESACALLEKPLEEERCFVPPCPDVNNYGHENEIFTKFGAYDKNSIQINKLYTWKTDSWSSCSASCGSGLKKRNLDCVNTITGKPVSWNLCKSKNQPKNVTTCMAPTCVTWYADKWKQCSAECGKGYEERDVTCVSMVNGKPMDESHCAVQEEKPESRRSCESHRSCKPISTWRTGSWGECSEVCGGGVKERKVVCQPYDGTRKLLDEEMCVEPKPSSSMPCNEQPCNGQPAYTTIDWNFGEWAKCNVTCGSGYRHRQVQCQNSEGALLAAEQCDGLIKPAAAQPCQAPAPCRGKPAATTAAAAAGVHEYAWKTSKWSACSTTCGPGVQTRRLACRRYNGDSTWSDAMDGGAAPCVAAAGSPPATRRTCATRPCGSEYGWTADEWGECSHACGKKGRQTRRVNCYHRATVRKAHRRHCDPAARPPKNRKCNRRRCAGHKSCAHVLRKHRAGGEWPRDGERPRDGEYVLNVFAHNVSVYCRGMRTGEPAEYLTLRGGDEDNFSEIYEHRLRDPSTCPFNGKRHQPCLCDNVPVPSSGWTVFQKIRFNVTSLRIDANDFTFSKQIRGRPVPFGEAGDCYSKSKSGCPQGRFGIDLAGTGMKISRDITWVGKGSNTSFWVKYLEGNTKITGQCGGYCGTCVSDQGLILDFVTP